MRKIAVFTAGLLTLGLALHTQLATAASTNKEDAKTTPAGTAYVRLLQAVPDGPALKVNLNDTTAEENLAKNTLSSYHAVPSGKCHFVFTSADGDTKFWNSYRTLDPNTYYTAVLFPDEDKPRLKLEDESSREITEGKARIYFYNLSPDAGDLRITVDSKRAKAGYVQWLKRVRPGSASSKSATTGDFTLQIRQDEKVLKEIPNFKVEKGQRSAVFILGKLTDLSVITGDIGAATSAEK